MTLLLLIAAGAVATALLAPRLIDRLSPDRARAAASKGAAQISAAASRGAAQVGGTARGWVGRIPGLRRRPAAASLPVWAADLVAAAPLTAPVAEGFRPWAAGLSAADAAALEDRLARACTEAGADLAWLRGAELAPRPELRRALEETVALAAVGAWRAAEARPESGRVRAYLAWLAAPDRGANRAVGDRLYLALVARGVAEPRPDLLVASRQARRGYVREAVMEAAARDPQLFDVILAEALAPASSRPPAPLEAAPAPQAEPPALAPVVVEPEAVESPNGAERPRRGPRP